MKIYNSSTAPNPRRVRVFLAEKGIQVQHLRGYVNDARADARLVFSVTSGLHDPIK
jgi:glutathione S-transferase